MTEEEMLECNKLFWADSGNPIYNYWDQRTNDKRLLCASADEATVYRFILTCDVATEEDKQIAEQRLTDLDAEDSVIKLLQTPKTTKPTKPIPQSDYFLIVELDWESLSMQRRKELLTRCGYSSELWNEPWAGFLPHFQVLVARELEQVSGGFATLKHNPVMEELRNQTGWEQRCDPRLKGKAKPPRTR
jgi:hypothetical protein